VPLTTVAHAATALLPARPDLVDLRVLTVRWRLRRDAEGLLVIPGRRGHVAPHDRTALEVYLEGGRFVRAVLRVLPAGWRRHQVGDDEAAVLAPVADLELACRLVRAYRRRRLTDAQRARLVAAGRPFSARAHEANGAVSAPRRGLQASRRPVTAP